MTRRKTAASAYQFVDAGDRAAGKHDRRQHAGPAALLRHARGQQGDERAGIQRDHGTIEQHPGADAQSNLTQDPTAKADLQNRMAAEEAMVQNDQTRMQLTAQLQQAEICSGRRAAGPRIQECFPRRIK